jgi:hypothetical protein
MVSQWMQFFATQIATVFAAALCLYPYTVANGGAGSQGPTKVCPRQTPGAITTNLLKFYNDFHAAGIGHGQGK